MPDGSKIPAGHVSVARFKARLSAHLARAANGETLTITKRGHAMAKLCPPEPAKRKSIFGGMVGRGRIVGDIVSPLDIEWNVLKPDAKLDPD